MKKAKLLAAALAVVTAVATMPTTASAGYGGFYFPKYIKHFKHIKHIKHMKVKSSGGHNGGGSGIVWYVIGCAGGVVLAALAANYRDGRELSAQEAWSCGTLFWFTPPH